MLYNRDALFVLQQCCFNSGSAPKIGNGPVCSGRVSMLQRNLVQVQERNSAVCFQCNCSSTSGPQTSAISVHTLTCKQYVVHVCAQVIVCVLRSECVWARPASYCISSSLFSFPDYRWKALIPARPFITSDLLLKAFY